MNNESLIIKLIGLRISLQSLCDGFNAKQANKTSLLTMDKKVLFMLSSLNNCSPQILIENLGIAKSNLALLCKTMEKDGLILKSNEQSDKRKIFYNITSKGKEKLNEFYLGLKSDILKDKNKQELIMLENNIDQILKFINNKNKVGKNND